MSQKVVSYIRVSTDEQAKHGYSIDVQKQVLEDYAAGHDLDTVQTFIESESAYKPGRREFNRMTDYLIKHKMITAVLCYKIDRISRNMSDYSYLVEKLGVEILSATEQLPSNPTGRLMGDMQAAFSRYFSAQLSERVKEAMEAKARKGIYPSYAPVGYLNDRETRIVVCDSQMAPIIRELFATYANTAISVSELVKWARKRGLRTRKGGVMAKSAIHKVLSNPIYVGTVHWGNVRVKGIHDPLVPQYLFDRVQAKLHSRGHRQTKHDFPFRGVLICGYCGCQITASLIKGKYVYYHCTKGRGKCRQPYIRQEALSQRFQSVVDNVRIPQEIVGSLLEKISSGEDNRRETVHARLQELQTEEKELERRRNLAYIDKLNGVLSEERWRQLEAQWSQRAQLIIEQRQRLQNSLHATAVDSAKEAFELLQHASELYAKQPYKDQAKALRLLVSNCTLMGETIEPNYKKPFDLVAEGVKTDNWYAREDLNLRPSHPQCDALSAELRAHVYSSGGGTGIRTPRPVWAYRFSRPAPFRSVIPPLIEMLDCLERSCNPYS